MKNSEKKQDHILQFRFSPDAVERLDSLKSKNYFSTRAEVIRNALRLYEYFIEKSEEGYTVQLVRGEEKLTIVPLSGV